jgi:hypothetical protein
MNTIEELDMKRSPSTSLVLRFQSLVG